MEPRDPLAALVTAIPGLLPRLGAPRIVARVYALLALLPLAAVLGWGFRGWVLGPLVVLWCITAEYVARTPRGASLGWRLLAAGAGLPMVGLCVAAAVIVVGRKEVAGLSLLFVGPLLVVPVVLLQLPLWALVEHAHALERSERLDAALTYHARGLRVLAVVSSLSSVFADEAVLPLTAGLAVLATLGSAALWALDRRRARWLGEVASGHVPGWTLAEPTDLVAGPTAPPMDLGAEVPSRVLVSLPGATAAAAFRGAEGPTPVARLGPRLCPTERARLALWCVALTLVGAGVATLNHGWLEVLGYSRIGVVDRPIPGALRGRFHGDSLERRWGVPVPGVRIFEVTIYGDNPSAVVALDDDDHVLEITEVMYRARARSVRDQVLVRLQMTRRWWPARVLAERDGRRSPWREGSELHAWVGTDTEGLQHLALRPDTGEIIVLDPHFDAPLRR
ncbi:MAG: hypothetical protein HY909_08865 [Deltaproteobacteria bacterium]|nr:hypothetical protein [Deltaproteobacteria bacterium]